MASSIRVTRLRHATLAVPFLERSRRFFIEDWGLTEVARRDGGSYLRTRRDEPFQLALIEAPRRGLAGLSFGLDSARAVDAAAATLAERGVAVTTPQGLQTPGGGYGFRFTDPDGRCVELSADVARFGRDEREDSPEFLSHVVLNTPDLTRSTAFYTDVLGFRISDWSEDVMTFLRCDAEHHAVAFNTAPHASLNHTSWQRRSIDDLFRAQGRVRAAGMSLAWGTGRHAPGRQVFNYFVEPSGFVVENIADGITIEDESSWVPQVFRREPAAMDLWNTAGPPSEQIRAAMLGEPDLIASIA